MTWTHGFVRRTNGDLVFAEIYDLGSTGLHPFGWAHPFEEDVRLIDLAKAWKNSRWVEQADGSIVKEDVSPVNDKEDTK